jgi:hypothetical protein
MHLFIFVALALFGGVGIGFIGSSWISKEEVVAKTDLTSWRARLASAATADEAKAKLEMKNIVTEIETKLKKL